MMSPNFCIDMCNPTFMDVFEASVFDNGFDQSTETRSVDGQRPWGWSVGGSWIGHHVGGPFGGVRASM